MSAKKIIIHCGMPKTGTSALQVQLAQNRDLLLGYGYDYPPLGEFSLAHKGHISSGNGFELASAYFSPGQKDSRAQIRDEVIEGIREVISGTQHHVILSSEYFTSMGPGQFGDMVSSLKDLGAVHLVFFVREQVNALTSAYIQSVKRAMETRFPDTFFAEFDLSKRRHMAYHTYFQDITDAAPDATLLVKPYELSQTHAGGLMGLFLDMIGAEIPADSLPADKHINLSPSPQEVRLLIEANKHRPRPKFSDMVIEASHVAGRSAVFADHRILPPAVMRQIETFFAAENEAFFARFAKCENIYKARAARDTFIDLRTMRFDPTDVVDVAMGLLVKIDLRVAKLERMAAAPQSIRSALAARWRSLTRSKR